MHIIMSQLVSGDDSCSVRDNISTINVLSSLTQLTKKCEKNIVSSFKFLYVKNSEGNAFDVTTSTRI